MTDKLRYAYDTSAEEPANQQAGIVASAVPLGLHGHLVGVLLIWSILLNGALAVINQNVKPVGQATVATAQVFIITASLFLAFIRPSRTQIDLILMVILLGALSVIAAFSHPIGAKFYYDVLIIPAFALLGLSLGKFPTVYFKAAFTLVCLSAALEVISLPTYVSVFNPASYLFNTRDWVAAAVAAGQSKDAVNAGLYLGSSRSGGSVFSFISDHRIGGLFLEPLSLGYFAIISTFAFSVIYKRSRVRISAATIACLMLALLADSRLAASVILFTYAVSMSKGIIPRGSALLVPPMLVVLLKLCDLANLTRLMGGDASYRLQLTFSTIEETSLLQLLSGNVSLDRVADSGFVYLVSGFTIIGVIPALWIFGAGVWGRFADDRHIPVAASFYVTFASMVGGAFLSIKTAALLGCLLGCISRGRINFDTSRRAGTDQAINQ